MHFQIDVSLSDRRTIWIDVANRSVNVFNESIFDELDTVLDSERLNSSNVPLVFRSAKKKGFVVGADLTKILAIQADEAAQSFLRRGQEVFSRLEQWPANTVAVIQGACLGGGLEFALACKYRLAVDVPETQLGMPESKLGLMPGWGGTQRLVEQVGMQTGLDMLLKGESVSSQRALRIGLVDGLLSYEELEANLTLFLRKIHPAASSKNRNSTGENEYGCNSVNDPLSDAQLAILKAVETGVQLQREDGFRVERESFFALLSTPGVRSNIEKIVAPKRPMK